MLTLSELKKFYFLPNFHDMRCKAPRVAEIVRNKYHRDLSEGMTTMEELRGYIRFLYGQYMEEKEQNRQQQAAMQESLDEMARQLKEANATARLESDERRKTYMWCLVNRALGIVIFFYEDTTDENGVKHEGGRGRNMLLDFLGDAKIKSLQSDGYNVYTYLDEELMDIEHLCCMDHFWAKAKKALNQGCKKAQFFVTEVGKLYRRERFYKEKGLSAERIKEMRNDSYTQGIIDRMKERMEKLLAEGEIIKCHNESKNETI